MNDSRITQYAQLLVETSLDVQPGSQVVVIPDAGHSPQFENPDAWIQAIEEFLAKVGP